MKEVKMLKSKAALLKKGKVPIEGLFCNYSHRTCMQNRLEGYEYCLKHILEDKNSPFKQCNYVSNRSAKRCSNAAPKSEKRDGFCAEHSKKALTIRQKASRKRKPQETPESILEELEHYGTKAITNEQGNEIRRHRPSVDSVANRILDYASSSDSDTEPLLVDQAWRGDDDSDAESVDNEMEDPLKLASVYTAEEVALITRDKLIRLQSLYIDQFKRLQHIMKEKRRRYIHASRHERDKFGSIHAAKDDPEQREKYDKLMAMKRYHKRNGKEALLHRQSKERRIAVSEGANYKPVYHLKCIQITDTGRCADRVVPLSKYCQKHIMNDRHQQLFTACGFGNGACETPIPHGVETVPRCPLHHPVHEVKVRLPPAESIKVECEDDITDPSIGDIKDTSHDTTEPSIDDIIDTSNDAMATESRSDTTANLSNQNSPTAQPPGEQSRQKSEVTDVSSQNSDTENQPNTTDVTVSAPTKEEEEEEDKEEGNVDVCSDLPSPTHTNHEGAGAAQDEPVAMETDRT